MNRKTIDVFDASGRPTCERITGVLSVAITFDPMSGYRDLLFLREPSCITCYPLKLDERVVVYTARVPQGDA